MATQIVETLVSPAPKKKLVRRVLQDRSQRIRQQVQWAFVVLNAWLGVQFYLWVRYFERGGQGLYVPRPAGRRRLAAHCGIDEPEVFRVDGRCSGDSSGGDVFADGVSRDQRADEKGILLVAVPGRHTL